MTTPRSRGLVMAVLTLGLGLWANAAAAQAGPGGAPFGGAMDDHFKRDNAGGIGNPSRAFAFAAEVEGPVVIEQVDERRKARGGHNYALFVRNRGAETIPSFVILGLVVSESGVVTSVQPLPPPKPLKGGQKRRLEMELRGVTLGQYEQLAFVISRVERPDGQVWTAPEADLREMAGEAALALRRR